MNFFCWKGMHRSSQELVCLRWPFLFEVLKTVLKQRAFYYVRVLEIPTTPRWSTYDVAFFGIELPKDVYPTHQERVYTSPIWYTP